ncbi:MAG TPA: hypothetical protein VGN63_15275 [Flavisolibacter sp.]|jgi:hypothetical protein|nr:hypothetical protein [Flavisolibacter sp.]
MDINGASFLEFRQTLNHYNVRYILVSGFAMFPDGLTFRSEMEPG